MTDWFPVLITNGLTAIITFVFTNYLQARSRKFETEKEYRQEIRKHMDGIIKPLFSLLQNLNLSLMHINDSIIHERALVLPQTRKIMIKDSIERNEKLQNFIRENRTVLSLMLPHPFPWIFVTLNNLLLSRILSPMLHPEWLEVFDRDLNYEKDMIEVIDLIENIQTDLRKLVGYDIDIKLATKHLS